MTLGDHPSHIPQAWIASMATVSTLKQAIKEEKENTFRNVDADSLWLWRVSDLAPTSIVLCASGNLHSVGSTRTCVGPATNYNVLQAAGATEAYLQFLELQPKYEIHVLLEFNTVTR